MSAELIKAFLIFLGIGVFSVWVFTSYISGLIALGVSIIAALVISWTISNYTVASEIFLFMALAAIAYHLRMKIQQESNQASVKIEEIQKNKNILMEGMFSHKGVQDALKKKLHRFFQLKELISHLSVRLDIDSVAGVVVESAFNIIGKSDSCYFYIVDTQQQQLALVAAKQKNTDIKIKTKTGDIFDHWTFKQRQPLFIEDVRKDYRFDLEKTSAGDSNFRSIISTPLISEEKIIGSIRLNSVKPNAFLANDLRLLDIISNLASVSLENASLYTRTKELAIRDSLTGVYVQKFFKERLLEEVTRSLRGDYSVSMLLLDIDFFKAYNDKYGHAAGDIVLKKMANILTNTVHDSGDIVARYGGEEFGIILINKTKEQAVIFAEGIRKKVQEQIFLLRREETKMTVSIGVSSCPEDAKISEDLIKAADDALYKAKKSGRNCVAVK